MRAGDSVASIGDQLAELEKRISKVEAQLQSALFLAKNGAKLLRLPRKFSLENSVIKN